MKPKMMPKMKPKMSGKRTSKYTNFQRFYLILYTVLHDVFIFYKIFARLLGHSAKLLLSLNADTIAILLEIQVFELGEGSAFLQDFFGVAGFCENQENVCDNLQSRDGLHRQRKRTRRL